MSRRSRLAPVLAALIALTLRCVTPRTEVIVTVDTDLPWGPGAVIDRVRVEVRDEGANGPLRDAQEFALGPDAGRVAMPLSFGILPRDGSEVGSVHVDVVGCRGACAVDRVTSARRLFSFTPRETRALRLTLSSRCRYVRCEAGTTCDGAAGVCIDALGATPRAPSATLAAGLGQTCAVGPDGAVVCWGDQTPGRATRAGPEDRAPPTAQPRLGAVRQVAVARAHGCAVTREGRALCWGDNSSGALGGGREGLIDEPVTVVDARGDALLDVAEVGVGWESSCARTTRGAVVCWGANTWSQLGAPVPDATRPFATTVSALDAPADQLSVGFTRACAALATGEVWCWGGAEGRGPARVGGLPLAAEVRVAWRHACARTREGRVYCWGDNAFGQLGRGDLASWDDARPVEGLTDVVALTASGFHTCALRADATLRCWGRGDLGQLGDGATATRNAPVSPRFEGADIARVRAVAAGVDHTCAIVDRGGDVLVCWGGDLHGELGTGRLLSTASPRAIALGDAVVVTASSQGGCATRGGVVRCWGTTDPGQSRGASGGVPREEERVIEAPRAIVGLASPFVEVALARRHTCARASDGTVSCWGANDRGQVGARGLSVFATPRPVPDLMGVLGVAAGESHTCARVEGDRARCWGANDAGQLGDGGGLDSATPRATNLDGVAEVVAGERFTCARTVEGAAWCWGTSARGAHGAAAGATLRNPTRVPSLTGVVALAAGADHACALLGDATVRCWGDGSSGQLGDGAATTRSRPAPVPGLRDVREVRAGAATTCALLGDATVRCWGRGPDGRVRATPEPVDALRGAVAIAVGADAACALVEGGGVWCWGDAERGALGAASRDRAVAPVQVRERDGRAFEGATSVAAGGARACALRGGAVWCWGAGDLGELGDGAWRERPVPVVVRSPDGGGITDARSVSAGARHACVVRADGRIACWGSNGDGRLGDGTHIDRAAPVYLALADVRFTEVAAGRRHTCGLARDGSVWCWGAADAGQLATSGPSTATPRRMTLPGPATAVRARGDVTCVLLATREVVCWGPNDRGQLGRGDTASHDDLRAVIAADSRRPIDDALDVAVGEGHACAVRAGRSVWCWGDNARGQVTGEVTAPVSLAARLAGVVFAGVSAVSLGAGDGLSCASGTAGYETYCWGDNAEGRVDPMVPPGVIAPVDVAGRLPNSQLVSFGAGRDFLCVTSEFLEGPRCAGANGFGQIGVGTRAPLGAPLLTLDALDLRVVASGDEFTCGVAAPPRPEVPMRCWGRNEAGQLGAAEMDGHPFAQPALGATGTRAVTAGSAHRCALLDDGTVRCWGRNALGQLGLEDLSDRDVPTDVPSLERVASLSAGLDHMCAALASDGAVRCWGRDDRLQLGEFSTGPARRYAARGVLGAARVASGADHTCALLRDGRVACWGDASRGQIGDGGETGFASLPVVVPGLARVASLASGARHTCAADADGAVMCWGDNAAGQLGDGTRTRAPRPVRVRDLSRAPLNAVEVGASRDERCAWRADGVLVCALSADDFTCARRADGAVMCWGANDRGQLGDGSRASRNLAGTVAGVTGARALTVGARHACALSAAGWVCWGDNRDGALGDGESAVRTEPVVVGRER